MPRKNLTIKQKLVAEEISKGIEPIEAVLKIYNCGGINPRASAKVILYKLRSNDLFNQYLTHQKGLVQEIIQREGQKLVDILEEIFPKVERARILVEIARSGDIKSKLEALKEINKIEGEYPREEPASKTEIGELKIVMIKGREEPERLRGEIIEPEELPVVEEGEIIKDSGGLKDEKNKDNNETAKEE